MPAWSPQQEVEKYRRRNALLETTLREVLRLHDAAKDCAMCVDTQDGFDGVHGRQWVDIIDKARRLVGTP